MSANDSPTYEKKNVSKESEKSIEVAIGNDFTQCIDPNDFDLDPSTSKRSIGDNLSSSKHQDPNLIVAPDEFKFASRSFSDMDMLPHQHCQLLPRNELQQLHSEMPNEQQFCTKVRAAQETKLQRAEKPVNSANASNIENGYVELFKPIFTKTTSMKDLLHEMKDFRRKVDAHKRKMSCFDDSESEDETDVKNLSLIIPEISSTPPTPPRPPTQDEIQERNKRLHASDWSIESKGSASPDAEERPPFTDEEYTSSSLTSVSSEEEENMIGPFPEA